MVLGLRAHERNCPVREKAHLPGDLGGH